MLSAFRKIVSSTYETQKIQENVGLVLKQITNKELLDGVLVSAVIESSATGVSHKLGRMPLGWVIVDRSAASAGSEGNIIKVSWDSLSITLKTTGSGSVPVTLWVF